MMRAIAVYRENFRPSAQLDRPYVMLGFNIFAADTDEEGRLLATSIQQAFVASRTGRPTQLPPPLAGYREQAPPHAQAILDEVLKCSAAGSALTVRRELEAFLDLTHADELMIVSTIFDHAARLRSYEILAGVRDAME
jgi:alkanesulfonate monooxygenase SsuD/methylene tetrahydromethanopterin reductase-like flavin-dependent oxidoreductase (luciferase family)